VQLPNITTGDKYCISVTANNGSGASTPIIIPWIDGATESALSFSPTFCSDDEFNITIDPTMEGALGAACATVATSINNPTGYATTLNAAANLTCSVNSGTYSLASASATPAALGNNQWGYAIGVGAPNAFQAVPTSAAIIQSSAVAPNDSFLFWIGAQVDYSQPACTHTGTITMTASPNPVPQPTLRN
jgi:hypothetical protein